MHLLHKWSRWSAPIEVRGVFMHFDSQKEIPYTEKVQNRECVKCGLIQEHLVDKVD